MAAFLNFVCIAITTEVVYDFKLIESYNTIVYV